MKNSELLTMLQVINEVLELEAKDISTTVTLVSIKKKIATITEEFKEALEVAVKFTDKEKELMQKAQGKTNDEILQLEEDNPKLAKAVKGKNLKYMEAQAEIMDKESDITFDKIDPEKLPNKLKGKHIESLSTLF